jgi:hypothetical protein
MWSFANADAYGISYFQGGTDTIGMHFGTPTLAASQFQFASTGNFTATANVTAYSDERLKTNWANLPSDFVERLASVKAGTYTRIDSGDRQAGSSAQDWQKLLPEVVIESEDGTLSLAYGNAALVACVKLAQRVLALEQQLKDKT